MSDEDYWASVSADRPFHSANDALDADPARAAADAARWPPRPGAARRGGAGESRLTADRPLGATAGRAASGPRSVTRASRASRA